MASVEAKRIIQDPGKIEGGAKAPKEGQVGGCEGIKGPKQVPVERPKRDDAREKATVVFMEGTTILEVRKVDPRGGQDKAAKKWRNFPRK